MRSAYLQGVADGRQPHFASGIGDELSEARSLDGSRDDLLAALKDLMNNGGLHLKSNVSTESLLRAHAAIARAEGQS